MTTLESLLEDALGVSGSDRSPSNKDACPFRGRAMARVAEEFSETEPAADDKPSAGELGRQGTEPRLVPSTPEPPTPESGMLIRLSGETPFALFLEMLKAFDRVEGATLFQLVDAQGERHAEIWVDEMGVCFPPRVDGELFVGERIKEHDEFPREVFRSFWEEPSKGEYREMTDCVTSHADIARGVLVRGLIGIARLYQKRSLTMVRQPEESFGSLPATFSVGELLLQMANLEGKGGYGPVNDFYQEMSRWAEEACLLYRHEPTAEGPSAVEHYLPIKATKGDRMSARDYAVIERAGFALGDYVSALRQSNSSDRPVAVMLMGDGSTGCVVANDRHMALFRVEKSGLQRFLSRIQEESLATAPAFKRPAAE